MDENELSNKIVGAAIEVHRALGPGLQDFVFPYYKKKTTECTEDTERVVRLCGLCVLCVLCG